MVITVDELCQEFKKYLVVDLRSERCYHFYHIPYSLHITLHKEYIIKTTKKVCFVCKTGQMALEMAERFAGSYYLDGGLESWTSCNADDKILKKCVVGEVCEGEECFLETNFVCSFPENIIG